MQTRIREFRKLRGMTLKELADKIKTTPQTVQRLETANMTVSMDWLEKIAKALNVEPADLLRESSSVERSLAQALAIRALDLPEESAEHKFIAAILSLQNVTPRAFEHATKAIQGVEFTILTERTLS